MQSHSHLQCYTQAQFSQAAVHTQQHISPPTQTQSPIGNIHTQRHTLVGVATHTDRYSGPLRHTLKLMDTFDCTETRSLSPHPGKQSYTHTFTPIHTQSHTHTHVHITTNNRGTIPPTFLLFLQEASNSCVDRKVLAPEAAAVDPEFPCTQSLLGVQESA